MIRRPLASFSVMFSRIRDGTPRSRAQSPKQGRCRSFNNRASVTFTVHAVPTGSRAGPPGMPDDLPDHGETERHLLSPIETRWPCSEQVMDLTGFELCNASLLDESSAAAEVSVSPHAPPIPPRLISLFSECRSHPSSPCPSACFSLLFPRLPVLPSPTLTYPLLP